MALIESLAIEGGKALIGAIAGHGMAKYNDERQIEQQRKLTDIQEASNKRQAQYGQELSYDLWNKTNYWKQVEHLKKAGLNVGLMYQQGGPGGTTVHGSAGQAAGAMAPQGGGEIGMGIQLALQTAMQKAQIENIAADTAVKQKEAGVKGAQEASLLGQAGLIAEQTNNTQIQNQIAQTEQQLKSLELSVKSQTFDEAIKQIIAVTEEAQGKARKAITEADVAEGIKTNLIQELNLGLTEAKLRIAGARAGIDLTKAQTGNTNKATQLITSQIEMLAKEKAAFWDKMNFQERQTAVREKLAAIEQQLAEFTTSTPQQIKQWTSMITDIMAGASQLPKGGRIGF